MANERLRTTPTIGLGQAMTKAIDFMKVRSQEDLGMYLDWTKDRLENSVGFEAMTDPTAENDLTMAKVLGENAAEIKDLTPDEAFSGILLAVTMKEISRDARSKNWARKYRVHWAGDEAEVSFNPWAQGMHARKNFRSIINEFRAFEQDELMPSLEPAIRAKIMEGFNERKEASYNG